MSNQAATRRMENGVILSFYSHSLSFFFFYSLYLSLSLFPSTLLGGFFSRSPTEQTHKKWPSRLSLLTIVRRKMTPTLPPQLNQIIKASRSLIGNIARMAVDDIRPSTKARRPRKKKKTKQKTICRRESEECSGQLFKLSKNPPPRFLRVGFFFFYLFKGGDGSFRACYTRFHSSGNCSNSC